MNDLISVIVPVYKVEQYLNDCINSLVNQSYKNLEIILVDDGSPDNCPIMCDNWAKKDRRIKVIHKKNGGLSSARNAGLDVANGAYLAFVDSDDFIAPTMYEDLYNMIVKYNADVAVSKIQKYYPDGQISNFKSNWNYQIKKDTEFDNIEYLHLCLSTKLDSTVWNKLYSKHLFSNVRFKEGRLTEDFLLTYYLINNIKKVIYQNKVHYNYRVRSNGICGTYAHINDTYLNIKEIYADLLNKHDYESIKYLNIFKLRFLISTCLICINIHPEKINYKYYYNELVSMDHVDIFSQSFKYVLFYLLLRYCPLVLRLKAKFFKNIK